MIDSAGIFTELVLASLATILWVFLLEGGLRALRFRHFNNLLDHLAGG